MDSRLSGGFLFLFGIFFDPLHKKGIFFQVMQLVFGKHTVCSKTSSAAGFAVRTDTTER